MITRPVIREVGKKIGDAFAVLKIFVQKSFIHTISERISVSIFPSKTF